MELIKHKMKFDTKIIDKELSLKTKYEQLIYLKDLLFNERQREAEFIAFDSENLERLKQKTSEDYDKYKNEFDKGRLVYFSHDKWDEIHAKRIGIKNVELLKKRLQLEKTFFLMKGRKHYFKAMIKRIEKIEPLQQPQPEAKTDTPPPKQKLTFKDFFVNTNEPTVLKIQNKFKDSADKDLVMLIYILNELERIEIILSSKTQSRKHFVEALIGKPKNTNYINNELKKEIRTLKGTIHDNRYFAVKNKLDKILNSKVV